jgi:hypothetical protein
MVVEIPVTTNPDGIGADEHCTVDALAEARPRPQMRNP